MPEPADGTDATTPPPVMARPGWRRWILPVACAALLPKCLMCVAGYLTLAGGLVTATTELCGEATGDTPTAWGAVVTGLVILAVGLWLMRRTGP